MVGPTTVDTTTVALGLAQIRIGASAANIAQDTSVLTSSDSMGAMATTKWMGEKDFWTLESGFPLLEDDLKVIRERASLECVFKELTPANLALAAGQDAADFALTHSGEIPLGANTSPVISRMEAIYTFPDADYEMHIIFPRAQVQSSAEIDYQSEDNVNSPIIFTSKRADSGITGGNAVWDNKPLGAIAFIDNS